MKMASLDMKLGLIASVTLVVLGGCSRAGSSAEMSPSTAVTSAAPAQPVAGESSTASTASTVSTEPAVSSMNLAQSVQKLGVPVDLHYQLDGDVTAGRSVMLHLAVVPRVVGSNLLVSVSKEAGISTTAGDVTVKKANASTAYRQQFLVTKLAGGPSELHVLVTMEMPEGSAHGWFNIPLEGVAASTRSQPNRRK